MQPIIIEDTIAIAANTVNDNVIVSNTSLRRYLRCPFDCQIKLVAVTSATGIRISFDYGAINSVADVDLRAGTDMQDPLDMVNDQMFARAGDQLVLRGANGTGGSLSLRYRLTLMPMDWSAGRPPHALIMQRGPVAVANNTVDQVLLDGLRYQRAPADCILTVWMTASAAGLTRQIYMDTDSIAPPSALMPLNRIPEDPFDINIEGVEVPADKQVDLLASNSSGGSLNVFWRTRLQMLQGAG